MAVKVCPLCKGKRGTYESWGTHGEGWYDCSECKGLGFVDAPEVSYAPSSKSSKSDNSSCLISIIGLVAWYGAYSVVFNLLKPYANQFHLDGTGLFLVSGFLGFVGFFVIALVIGSLIGLSKKK